MKSTNSPKAGLLLLFIILFVLPGRVYAAVIITEVMYDLSGSDSGREWVEITNTGQDPVDVSKYRFFEANTNHELVVSAGSTTLAAGQAAVIADVPGKFLADWPQYSGTLFDSSFSLSNTGETVALKDDTLAIIDSVTYSSDGGAAGDGNSLHRVGDTLVPGAPDPGVYTGSAPPPVAPDPTTTDTTSTDTTPPDTQTATSTSTGTTSDASSTPATSTDQSATTTPAETASTTPTSAQTQTQTQTPTHSQTATTASTQPIATSTASAAAKTATASSTPASTAAATTTPTHAETTPIVTATSLPGASSASKKAALKSTAAATTSVMAGDQEAAAAASGLNNPLWLYVAGFAALLMLGAAAGLYVWPQAAPAMAETPNAADEFDIEG